MTKTQMKTREMNPLFAQTGMDARLHGGSRIRVRKSSIFDVARHLAASDRLVRASYHGEPIEMIERQASNLFKNDGVKLTERDLHRYAQSVADGEDYRFVVAY